MSTLYRYTVPGEETHWKFPASGDVTFTWDYDARIDWSLPVDPEGKNGDRPRFFEIRTQDRQELVQNVVCPRFP